MESVAVVSGASEPESPVRGPECAAILTALGLTPARVIDLHPPGQQPPGSVVFVRGEAGAGKTYLVGQAATAAAAAGRRVVRADAYPHATGVPFGPFVDVTADLVDLAGGPGPAADLAGAAAWDVLARLDPQRAGPDTPVGGLELPRLVAAFVTLLRGVCDRRPVVLVLEDLHWADTSSLGLVLRLVRRPPAGCALVLTWREPVAPASPLRRLLGELLRSPHAQDVALRPLPDAAVRALLALERPAVSPAQVRHAVRHAAGNPFAALALAGSDNGSGSSDSGGPGVPSRLGDVLLAGTIDLTPGAEDALHLLAVAARPLGWDVLGTAAGLTEAELQEAVDELAVAGLLASGADRLCLRHAMLSDVVVSAVPPGRRRALHRRLARALVTADGPDRTDAEVAVHLRAAGRLPEARTVALRAAREAAARCAYPEAVTLFDLALSGPVDLAAGPAGLSARVSTLLEAADVSRWAQATARGLAWADEAAQLCAPDGGAPRDSEAAAKLAAAHHVRGRVLWAHGDPQGSLDAYRQAVRTLPPGAPDALRARLTASLASGLMTMSRFREARDTAATALTMLGATATGTPPDGDGTAAGPVVQHALVTWGVSAAETGDLQAGLRALARARAASTGHDPDAVVRAYANSTFVLAHAGRWREAVRLADDALAWGRRIGLSPASLPILVNNRVSGLIALGEWPQARRAADEVLDDVQAPSGGFRLALYLSLAELAALCGQDVEDALRPARGLPGVVCDPLLAVYAACARAEAAVWRGAAHEAAEQVTAGLAVAETAGLPHETVRLAGLGLRALADLGRHGGGAGRETRRRAAAERRDALLALVDRVAGSPPGTGPPDTGPPDTGTASPELRAAVLAARAEAARLDDDPAAESAAWAQARAAWTVIEQVYPAAYATWRQAVAEFARRRAAAAVPLLGEATGVADALGARPLSEACRMTARAAGVEDRLARPTTEPAGPATTGPATTGPAASGPAASGPAASGPVPSPEQSWRLTARERQVLELLAQGLSNRRVARQLGISEKTVSVHLSNLYAKLGVTGRTEAVSVMIRSLSVDHR